MIRDEATRNSSVIPGTSHAPGAADYYLRRMQAELAELQSQGVRVSGNAFCTVLFVKGQANEDEQSSGEVLCGSDGDALRAALARLGYTSDAWAALLTERITNGVEEQLSADLVAYAVEVFDPELVIILDALARASLIGAWSGATFDDKSASILESAPEGALVRIRGRRVLLLEGFEAALDDARAKQIMWARLKQVPPLSAPSN